MTTKITITVKVPKAYVEIIDRLVQKGLFNNRSEAVRVAIKELLKREMFAMKSFFEEEDDEEYKGLEELNYEEE